ncbi:hypothetical protein WM54_01820 [Aeromonas veronii]|nr:hypothetical protein WM54_01820 [Aeromonas veronii]
MSQQLNKLIAMCIITVYCRRGKCAVFISSIKKKICVRIVKNNIIITISQDKFYTEITLIYLIDSSQQCYNR